MEPSKSVMRPILPNTTEVCKYVFKSGRFYEDELVNKVSFELLNGFTYENGDTYKGVIKNGEFTGEFKAKKSSVYIGSFKSWIPNGHGQLAYKHGGVFEGTIKNRELIGGIFKFSNGSIYQGSFFNYKFEGLGIMLYKSGNSYEGMWKSHKRHGWGQMIYRENGKDVRTYEGFWEDDKECDSKMNCEKLA